MDTVGAWVVYRAVRDPLGLDPMKEGLAPEIVNDVKAVLSGLVTSVQSIGSLRRLPSEITSIRPGPDQNSRHWRNHSSPPPW